VLELSCILSCMMRNERKCTMHERKYYLPVNFARSSVGTGGAPEKIKNVSVFCITQYAVLWPYLRKVRQKLKVFNK
jgi:hypothetical protein